MRDQVVADQSAFSESSMAGLELAAGFGQLVQTSSACLSSSEGSGALAGGERHTRVALCRAVHAERLGPAADAWRRVPHHATAQGRPRARRPRPTNGDRRCSSAAGANTVHLKFSINIRSDGSGVSVTAIGCRHSVPTPAPAHRPYGTQHQRRNANSSLPRVRARLVD